MRKQREPPLGDAHRSLLIPRHSYASIQWVDGVVRMLDQRRLPHEVRYLDYDDEREVAAAIRDMVIRGAPGLGAAGAFGLALAAQRSRATEVSALRDDLGRAAEILTAARPTAINLDWGIRRVMARVADPTLGGVKAIRSAVLDEAQWIAREDSQVNRRMGANALPLIPDDATIIHHCNTGGLATVEYGTAMGIIRAAHEAGKRVRVLVDETRPRLQGARLTAWELGQLGIPHTVIVDGASGHFMRTGHVDCCIVGCDRVAANGDTANKIGTYNLAIVARAHDVPFYVAAPTSSIDLGIPNGDAIPIEERSSREITHIGAEPITPVDTVVANPAFDVTTARFITAFVTEAGVAWPPFDVSLRDVVARARVDARR
jgi:methylthioribose-1-phosphate isomerase